MERKILKDEPLNLVDEDYKSAIIDLYRQHTSRLSSMRSNYRSLSKQMQVYEINGKDGLGNPVKKNVEAYNDLSKQRKHIAIIAKFTENEIEELEKFWAKRGFDLEELRNCMKSKELKKKG